MSGLRRLFRWRRQHPEFAALYSDAQETYQEITFAEMKRLVDDRGADFIDKATGKPVLVNHSATNRSRLQYDQRRNRLAKLNPRKYGDLQRDELSGPNGSFIEVKSATEPLSDFEAACCDPR